MLLLSGADGKTAIPVWVISCGNRENRRSLEGSSDDR